MYNILIGNFGFWFNIIIPICVSFYLFKTQKEYIFKEFGLQILASTIIVIGSYFLFFSTTTNLFDTEYQNAKVKSFEYYEQWTERVEYTEEVCSGSGKNRHCKTVHRVRYDYHPPYWQLHTTNNETISINSQNYFNAKVKYGEDKTMLWRTNQSSFGDGNKYTSLPLETLPTAVGHSYVNYVIEAKNNVIHNKFSEEEINQHLISKDLVSYPTTYNDHLGVPKLNRIIDTTGMVNTNEWKQTLDLFTSEIAPSKQSNLVVYFTKQDRTFSYILEYYWNKAKKNDVILVIGLDKDGKINWTEILAWTNNTDFLVDGSKFLNDDKFTINNKNEILTKFRDLVIKGYVRKPMAEFDYLAENIELKWYWQLMIILINAISAFFIARYFLKNDMR